MSPIEITCPDCGALPGQKCSEPQFGVYEFTFHNMRIQQAAKPRCKECREVGMLHCSDPLNCGGMQ